MENGRRNNSIRYGLAADLGTSRIRLSLADLDEEKILGTVCVRNREEVFGEDVLTRIEYASSGEENRLKMREACLSSLREGVELLCKQVLRGREEGQDDPLLYAERVVIAGNTAMTYLALGLDPSPLVKAPFEIPEHTWPSRSGAETGLPFAEEVFFFPCPANYLGGDLVSGIYALGLENEEDGTALFDLGINSELVIKNGDVLYAGSCAAGPAYEIKTQGDDGGETLTGSETVALMAELLENGALNRRGRLQKEKDERITEVLSPLTGRNVLALRWKDGGLIPQSAIGTFLQSKASTATMIEYMCGIAGVEEDDLKKWILTGIFGNNLDPKAAASLGMIPESAPEKVLQTENLSLKGAEKLLLADDFSAEEAGILRINDRIRYVQLREVEDYLEMMVPHLFF
ncbi:MAG: DUF4445 domain-containing protein [Lachnospiraceae bacterium]|nr:DUF4445 domain-containing protein [Lachnospiraceae bacterium]